MGDPVAKAVKIPAMFAKAAEKPSPKCPICNVAATLKVIDKHLEDGCPTVTKVENAAIDDELVLTLYNFLSSFLL